MYMRGLGQRSLMKCLGCGAEMRLMQVDPRGDPTAALAFERHTFKCSACSRISQRLVFSRAEMPANNLPVVTPRQEQPPVNLQERVTVWTTEVNELRKRRTEQIAAAKAMAWAKAVEKVRNRRWTPRRAILLCAQRSCPHLAKPFRGWPRARAMKASCRSSSPASPGVAVTSFWAGCRI